MADLDESSKSESPSPLDFFLRAFISFRFASNSVHVSFSFISLNSFLGTS